MILTRCSSSAEDMVGAEKIENKVGVCQKHPKKQRLREGTNSNVKTCKMYTVTSKID